MNLYLSKHSHLNSTYSNEQGQALFSVETPWGLGIRERTATITRVNPNFASRADEEHTELEEDVDFRDHWTPIGQVQFHTFKSSILVIGHDEVETSTYFRKEGLGWLGRWLLLFTKLSHSTTDFTSAGIELSSDQTDENINGILAHLSLR